MSTSTHPGLRPAATTDRSDIRSRRTLRFDGRFLIVAGLVQVVSEILSHYASTGLHDDTFAGSPYTIGFVEAHGLAAMIGVSLLWAANQPNPRFFHGFAIVTHLLLAVSNVIFWDSFVEFGFVAGGVLATAAHVVFIVCQAAALAATPLHSAVRPGLHDSEGSR